MIVDDDAVTGGRVGRGSGRGFWGLGWFGNDSVTSGPVHAECGGTGSTGLACLVRRQFKGCLSVSLLVCVGLDAEMVGGDLGDLSLAARFLYVVVLLEGHFHAVFSGEDLHARTPGRPLDG